LSSFGFGLNYFSSFSCD